MVKLTGMLNGVNNSRSRIVVAPVVVLVLAFTACTSAGGGDDPRPQDTPNDATALGPLGSEGCEPASPLQGIEAQGTPTGDVTSAYGEFQGVDPTQLRADASTVKLVVRINGSGELRATLRSPEDEERALDWGPEAHVSSNYARPGEEWGTGFSFESAGCWELLLERGYGAASFWMEVRA